MLKVDSAKVAVSCSTPSFPSICMYIVHSAYAYILIIGTT